MSLFETKMSVLSDTPIYALSDIHADIDALIIALRDCAKVIRKKPDQNVINADGTTIEPQLTLDPSKRTEQNLREASGDQLLEYLLKLDLNVANNDTLFEKNVDFGYEWCGGKSHVVIIGDILDGRRPNTALNSSYDGYVHQYPQVEVKILKFLNHLDEMASTEENKGRIIKLIGNHEHMNFNGSNCSVMEYAFSNSFKKNGTSFYDRPNNDYDNYYKGLSRIEYFNIGKPGYDLYTKRGSGILLMINNGYDDLIFCHGTLTNQLTYEQIDEINMNISKQKTTDTFNNLFKNELSNQTESILWARHMGQDKEINKRYINKDKYCESKVEPIIQTFCKQANCTDINKVKIILGHCNQNNSSYYDENNRTFKTVESEDSVRIIYNGTEMHEGKSDFSNNIIFGITMECDSPTKDTTRNDGSNKRIYRVDVGASRTFDQDLRGTREIVKNIGNDQRGMKKYLHSRTPQVLFIDNGDFKIIKSKYENTHKHQPRMWLETILDSNVGLLPLQRIPPTTLQCSQQNVMPGGYKQKYLKYKQKYLELKKLL